MTPVVGAPALARYSVNFFHATPVICRYQLIFSNIRVVTTKIEEQLNDEE